MASVTPFLGGFEMPDVQSDTMICNLALDKIGAGRITDLETGTTVQTIKCKTHYYQDRNMLQRLHWWRFNADRAKLAQDATWDTDNDQHFEWTYRYALPYDFLCLRAIYSSAGDKRNRSTASHAIERNYIYSNLSAMYIRYSMKIIDAGKFDPLFVEVLKLKLALDLYPALAKTGSLGLLRELKDEYKNLMIHVFAMDRKEQDLLGRDDKLFWIDARRRVNTGRMYNAIA